MGSVGGIMTFVEHNNRKRANKFAEYITGIELRKYTAEKVKKYCGDNPSVFDGAGGSGQLEQFIQPSVFTAVEIQNEACEVLQENYPSANVINDDFFVHTETEQYDAIVMNPPFSLQFKEQSEEAKTEIQKLFSWKKSGKVDDIFMLKSLEYSKRYGFYIMFPGIAYRSLELKMRELIGNRLLELNTIENAFEDTPISVIFIIIDKEKTSDECIRELYDCKTKKQLASDKWKIDYEKWEQIRIEAEKEEIDIDFVNSKLDQLALDHLENHLASQLMVIQAFQADVDYLGFISEAYDILNKYELYYNFGGST